MVLARRLLMATSTGGSFAPPYFPVTALTTAPSGGWVQVITPRAIQYAGTTYFAYVRGDNGNEEIRSYSGSVSAATVLHAALEVDTHDAPAILIRDSDKRILTFYTKHAAEAKIYQRVSTNAQDISSFAAETTIAHGTHQTYCSPVQLTSEASSPIYLYTRDTQSSDTVVVMARTISTDDGVTWGAQAEIVRVVSTTGPYWIVSTNGTDRVDFAVSDGNGVSDDPVNTYHMYWQSGNYHQSDGTVISASQPFAPSDMTLVYSSATAGPGWPTGIARDGSGNIAILVEVATHRTGGLADQTQMRYAWWNGTSWTSHAIVTSVDTGLAFVSHSALDGVSPDTVYAATAVSGVYEMSKYVTPDQGATWATTSLTTGSAGTGNVYPLVVTNRAADLRAMWLYGTYTTYLSNSLGIKGGQ